ncbi:MAG: HAD family phosphatase [Gemmataceae bacterium]|nr:HAD family phosphatase [Gemmata sp.]MDW8196493.1 HAD family phosphatase [Gemmataceae bacterium]
MTPPAIIWDVDGTLVDTAEHHFRAWERIAAERGYLFTRNDFAATFGKRNPEIVRQLFNPHATDDECRAWGEQKEKYYRDAIRNSGVALLPGVARLLETLAEWHWPQAVGSSAPRENLDLVLSLTNTRPFFQAIVSGDEVQRGKPDPEVFLKAADRLGVSPSHCIVIEDAPSGVEAAKAGGMACVAVTYVGHHSEEKLLAAGADLVVPTLEQLNPEQLIALVK